ncbi:MAG: anthranilate synthase component I [Gammaproteobacteria bacterium]
MDAEQFTRLAAEGYNRIPVVRELLADLDTPLSAYMKLGGDKRTFLLESVLGGEKWGHYSFIGLAADTQIRVKDSVVRVETGGKVVSEKKVDDPFQEIEAFRKQYRVPHLAGLPRFSGGLVGYFGYDCIRYIEPKVGHVDKADPLDCPDILLLVCDRVVVFDNVSSRVMLIVHADPATDDAYAKAQKELDVLEKKLVKNELPQKDAFASGIEVEEKNFVSGFSKDKFTRAVRRVKDYIVEGDAMQVVLSQRLSIPFKTAPLQLYRALRCTNPSPYMFHLHFDDFHVVGASPEVLTRLEDDVVSVRPIAGTRPRGATAEQDQALEKELLADPKELAEHLMLIDLGRNDVGRVAATGSVQVTEKMTIERYSHVMHIVSNVIARIRQGVTAVEVLKNCFPAGTVSGAPKIRAMQIIDELEPVRRGVYSGAVGYISWAGNMDTAIAIRTAVIKQDTLHIQAGAGIVADSDPDREWDETMNKGRAIFRAVSLAEKGLR